MKISCIISLFFLTTQVFAQQSVHSSGGSFTGTGGSVSVSVGQIAFTSVKNDSFSVSQGVQQVWELSPQSVKRLKVSSVQTRVYPNPVTEGLLLDITEGNAELCRWVLSDLQGREVLKGHFTDNQAKIPAEGLRASAYILSIYEKNQIIQSQKIIKK